jgi:hypothetical protein
MLMIHLKKNLAKKIENLTYKEYDAQRPAVAAGRWL